MLSEWTCSCRARSSGYAAARASPFSTVAQASSRSWSHASWVGSAPRIPSASTDRVFDSGQTPAASRRGPTRFRRHLPRQRAWRSCLKSASTGCAPATRSSAPRSSGAPTRSASRSPRRAPRSSEGAWYACASPAGVAMHGASCTRSSSETSSSIRGATRSACRRTSSTTRATSSAASPSSESSSEKPGRPALHNDVRFPSADGGAQVVEGLSSQQLPRPRLICVPSATPRQAPAEPTAAVRWGHQYDPAVKIVSWPEAEVPHDLRVQVLALQDQAWPSDEQSEPGPTRDPALRPQSMLLIEDGRVLAALDILSKDIV